MTKVLFVSAGAVGAYFGGRLQQGGTETAVTVRSDFETVRDNGFRITSDRGDFVFHPDGVYRSAAEYPGEPDYVVVTSKVLPWIDVPEMIRPVIRSSRTVIMLLQNGIGIEDAAAQAFPENTILSTVAYIGATRTGNGCVVQKGSQRLIIGKFGGGDSEKGRFLADLFRKGNVEAEYTENIARFRWKKLLWNTPFNTVPVLGGGLDTGEMCDGGAVEELCMKLMRETALTAKAAGHEFPEEDLAATMEYTRHFPPYKSSMLVDYEAGRALEAEAILGNVCRIADRLGADTPCLHTCYALLKSISDRQPQSKTVR